MKKQTIRTGLKGYNRSCGYYAEYTIEESCISLLKETIKRVLRELQSRGEYIIRIY